MSRSSIKSSWHPICRRYLECRQIATDLLGPDANLKSTLHFDRAIEDEEKWVQEQFKELMGIYKGSNNGSLFREMMIRIRSVRNRTSEYA